MRRADRILLGVTIAVATVGLGAVGLVLGVDDLKGLAGPRAGSAALAQEITELPEFRGWQVSDTTEDPWDLSDVPAPVKRLRISPRNLNPQDIGTEVGRDVLVLSWVDLGSAVAYVEGFEYDPDLLLHTCRQRDDRYRVVVGLPAATTQSLRELVRSSDNC